MKILNFHKSLLLCPSFAQNFVFVLQICFLFRLIPILILKLNDLGFLVCAIDDVGAVLHHFCHLYTFLFLANSKPWITAVLETIPGKHSPNPHTVTTAFHWRQSETGHRSEPCQYSFSSLLFLHIGILFPGMLSHVSFMVLPFTVWEVCQYTFT